MSRKFAMLRARHEAVNGRLKNFVYYKLFSDVVGICMGSAFLRLSTSFLLSWISALFFQSDPVAKSDFNEVLTAFANYSTSSYFDSALEPKLHPKSTRLHFLTKLGWLFLPIDPLLSSHFQISNKSNDLSISAGPCKLMAIKRQSVPPFDTLLKQSTTLQPPMRRRDARG